MRIPIPDRFPTKPVIVFTAFVFLAQQVEGTDLTFSVLTSAYLLIFAFAFNAGGGLLYPSGAWIFFNGVSTAILGLLAKVFVGEPGHTHLINPTKTMFCYCMGMLMVGFSAALARRLGPRTAMLGTLAGGETMKRAAVGCLLVGAIVQAISYTDFSSSGSFLSAIRQVNQLPRMAIILAVTHEITQSKGKRSTNWVVWAAGSFMFLYGAINFSKEGMFVPLITWLVPALALRFDFSKKQVIGVAFVIYFMAHYLVPFSQYGRRSRDENGSQLNQLVAAIGYFQHLDQTRQSFLETAAEEDYDDSPHFFDSPMGLFDREQMLAYDDNLIAYTDQGHIFGLAPALDGYANVVPRAIWKNKPYFAYGNDYGREIGVIDADDVSTGIAFSPLADAYHEAVWFGVFIVLPFVTFAYFFVTNSVTGSARTSPWALLAIAMSTHIAPEGLLQGTIYLTTYGIVAILLIATLCRWVLPLVSSLILGGDRSRLRRRQGFGSKAAIPIK